MAGSTPHRLRCRIWGLQVCTFNNFLPGYIVYGSVNLGIAVSVKWILVTQRWSYPLAFTQARELPIIAARTGLPSDTSHQLKHLCSRSRDLVMPDVFLTLKQDISYCVLAWIHHIANTQSDISHRGTQQKSSIRVSVQHVTVNLHTCSQPRYT